MPRKKWSQIRKGPPIDYNDPRILEALRRHEEPTEEERRQNYAFLEAEPGEPVDLESWAQIKSYEQSHPQVVGWEIYGKVIRPLIRKEVADA